MTDNTTTAPFFLARACFMWSKNRHYRVYLNADELLFLECGPDPNLANALHAGVHGGLVGGLIGGAFAASAKKKIEAARSMLDGMSLDELCEKTIAEPNFRAAPDDFNNVRIDPPSFWHGVKYSNHQHAGVIRCNIRDRGAYVLEPTTMNDMHAAVAALPELLNDVAVNVVWDERKKKFVAAG